MVAQHIIAVVEGAHIVYLQSLNGCERRIGRIYLTHEPHVLIVAYPPLVVVQAVLIAQFSLLVAYLPQLCHIVVKTSFALLCTDGESQHGFYIGGAVELAQVDDHVFGVASVKRVAHVWYVEQLTGKENHQVCRVGQRGCLD